MNQSYAGDNAPCATLTREVQFYKNNAQALLSRILCILIACRMRVEYMECMNKVYSSFFEQIFNMKYHSCKYAKILL